MPTTIIDYASRIPRRAEVREVLTLRQHLVNPTPTAQLKPARRLCESLDRITTPLTAKVYPVTSEKITTSLYRQLTTLKQYTNQRVHPVCVVVYGWSEAGPRFQVGTKHGAAWGREQGHSWTSSSYFAQK